MGSQSRVPSPRGRGLSLASLPALFLVSLLVSSISVAAEPPESSDSHLVLPGPEDGGAGVPYFEGELPPVPDLSESAASLPYQSGWPIHMGDHDQWTGGLAFEDLDGDGRLEVLAASATGRFFVWQHTGELYPGWPVSTLGTVKGKCATGDLDGDGDLEIVYASSAGQVDVREHHGDLLPGWPKYLGENYTISPSLYDLNEDGLPEILWADFQAIYAWERDGSLVAGFPVPLHGRRLTGTLAVGDVTGDSKPELVAITIDPGNGFLGDVRCYRADASMAAGWPVELGSVPGWGSASIADIDGDGAAEILAGIHGEDDTHRGLWVMDGFGRAREGSPLTIPSASRTMTPAVADLDGDGDLELVLSANGNYGDLYGWDHLGNPLPGWPPFNDFNVDCAPAIANLDGDADLELVVVNSHITGLMWATNVDGTLVDGFPVAIPTGVTATGPTVGDVDGDGDVEIGICGVFGVVQIYDLAAAWVPESAEWPTFNHDNWNTNQYGFVPPSGARTSGVRVPPDAVELRMDHFPNPVTESTTIRLAAPDGTWSIGVFDARGRLIRDLGRQRVEGRSRVVWNGADDLGRAVASGTYMIRANRSGLERTARIVVVR